MINEKSLASVNQSIFAGQFCKPLYDSYCFSRIPSTIKGMFQGKYDGSLPLDVLGDASKQYDAVVLLFVDGFGWRFLERYADKYPFLKRFLEQGTASKITSQFPSTTAPHVTCINTGLNVGQSGVYEWFYYEPLLDRMIAPLLFSFAGDKELNTLQSTGIDPKQLYPTQTVYQELEKLGVSSYVMQHAAIAHSPYSQVMYNGANNVPYTSLEDALKHLTDLYPKGQRSYFYLYLGDIDSMGHRHGIDSAQFEQAVEHCFTTLENNFWKPLQRQNKRGACILIADHGMVEVNPKTTIYLNKEIPSFLKFIKKNREGKMIAPAGSCRDFFLHIQEEDLGEAEDILKSYLEDTALVCRTSELIDQGFFGIQKPSKLFHQRVGNLVILPYLTKSVWWYEKGHFEQHFYGAHGGLTKEEMETIFLTIDL